MTPFQTTLSVTLNGKPFQTSSRTLADLLVECQLKQGLIAIELNCVVVHNNAYSTTLLQPEDKIEIIQFVGGG